MMLDQELESIRRGLRTLAVFRALLEDPVIAALDRYLAAAQGTDGDAAASEYAAFVHRLFAQGRVSLAEYVCDVVNNDENIYIRGVGAGEEMPPVLTDAVARELGVLQRLAWLTPERLTACLGEGYALPAFACGQPALAEGYWTRVRQIGRYGYGMYARYTMFYLDGDRIVPVKHPDATTLDMLIGYEREQQIVLDNTRALLAGRPAANVLLTGDAGTGKSSTVKAVVNELCGEGLRILEIRKDQLRQIPAILDELARNPLKFIIFIDDLSFRRDDDNFSALKAVLEGSIAARSGNVVIYATSNRRHLVKESFADREGDDIHRNDTMQELISLSERFGIHVTYQKPDKDTYLGIVHHLARRAGITMPDEELDLLGERFALERGGRSARAATQFVDGLIAART